MSIKNVLIIGNRELSCTIVSALLPKNETSSYRISVLTYPSQSPCLPSDISHDAVNHKISDFSLVSLQSAFEGQDLVISTIIGGDSELQIGIINAAIVAGVRRFIPHEFSYDSLNTGVQARVAKCAGRAKVIEHLRYVTDTNTGFEWVAIASGCILDSMLVSGDLGFDLQWHSATLHGNGTEKFAVSSIERVGIVVERIIRHWGEVKNQFIYAAGLLTSANEILKCLERETGSMWSVGYSDVDDCVREGQSRIERGYPDAGVFLLERSVLYDKRLRAADSFEYGSANELLLLKPESADTIINKAYHEFHQRGRLECGCT